MSFNPHTFYGTDGTLTVANQTALDADTLTKYLGQGSTVGRVVNVTLSVATEVKPFHEMGSRLPKELRAGKIKISGTVERAFINGALLRLMLGQYATDDEAAGFVVPTLDMVLTLDNQVPPGDAGNSVLTVYGVMFDGWDLNFPADDFALEDLSYMARRIKIADTEVPT
jgi:hypothetical protein